MRMLPLAVVLAAICPALSSPPPDEIPLSSWPSPPFWQPAGAAGTERSDPALPAPAKRETLALPSAPLPFVAVTPCRQYDSRSSTPLPDNTPRAVTLTGAPCGIPASAQAAAVNITVFNISGAGSNGVFKVGTVPPPSTAWINYPKTETQRANAGVVALTDAGQIVVQVNQGAGSVDFVVDVAGYYAPAGIVNSLNALSGDVTLAQGSNVTITPTGNTLTIAAAGGSGPPSGPAGGSLSGTYPNPGIASGAVGSTQLANSTAVRSINGAAQDLVTIQGSGAVSVGTAGGTITIGAPALSMAWGAPGDTTLIAAGYTEVAPYRVDYWIPSATTGAPAGRSGHTAVWTGTRMVVWGGSDGSSYLSTGGRYDPALDSWAATNPSGALSARSAHTAVWTGSKMIVWGGYDGVSYLDTGKQYDPVANTWSPLINPIGAPSPRSSHTAVWTGSLMVVWGGIDQFNYFNTGGRYDPAGGLWTATTTVNAPAGRYFHTAVWTGTRMVVWGGLDISVTALSTGGVYDPTGNSWTATNPSGAPAGRYYQTAVWTGTLMVVWGGVDGAVNLSTGGRYDPTLNSWSPTATTGAPSARHFHTAVWTGSRMVVWGGNSGTFEGTGAQYDPAGDFWAPTASGGPSARDSHAAVWTGTKMVVWGGHGTVYENTGGQWAAASLYVKN